MSIRTRTTKLIARRHDLNYFKRLSPIRAWQWYLAAAAMVSAVLWFSTSTLAHGASAFSAGPVSSSHAVFAQRCELCHVPVLHATKFSPAAGLRTRVPDSACLSCHTSAPHHPMESVQSPTCASCHTEHIASMHLASTADRGCTECHSKLESRTGALRVAASVSSFAGNHPDFRPLRTASAEEKAATFALRFPHAEHMKPGLRNPQGETVALQCQTCHQTVRTSGDHSAEAQDGRQGFSMAPVSFEKSCQSCHSLDFDKHIHAEAPHAAPAEVRAFVSHQLTQFAQAHPETIAAEIRNWSSDPMLPGRMRMPPPRNTQEWISYRTIASESILWRGKCELCHRDLNHSAEPPPTNTATLRQNLPDPGHSPATGFRLASFTSPLQPLAPQPETQPGTQPGSMFGADTAPTTSSRGLPAPVPGQLPLPNIEPAHQSTHWFKAAVFSHPAHQAVECVECHAAALSSTSGKDILMPSINTCRRCHDGLSSPQGPPVKAGHAESGCFLCHVYHGPEQAALKSDHNLAQLLHH